MSLESAPEAVQNFPCPSCGSQMSFDAALGALSCSHCGHTLSVPTTAEAIREYDLEATLKEASALPHGIGYGGDQRSIQCQSCGAIHTVDAHVISTECPFCGSNQVVPQEQVARVIKPESLVPFQVDRSKAAALFRQWLGRGFFRPTALKKIAREVQAKMHGVYLPFWAFDAFTSSWWEAEAGYYYTESETYWTTDERGQRVQRSRQVRKIRWQPTSGHLQLFLDDVLVPATRSLEPGMLNRLASFDLKALTPYKPEFLAGWSAEAYTVDLPEAWTMGQQIMRQRIERACAAQIPGDTYRNLRVDTAFSKMTYKHVLFPVWIASYRYRNRLYHFVVNGQTGEVSGQAPISWLRVILVLVVIGIILALFLWLSGQGESSATLMLWCGACMA